MQGSPEGAPTNNVLSAYVRPAGYNFVCFVVASNIGRCTVNILTGEVQYYGAANLTLVGHQLLTDGWRHIAVAVVGMSVVYIGPSNIMREPSTVWAGDGASGIHLWQVEVQGGTTIGSPIVTGAAIATRAADTVSIEAPSGSYALHLVMDDASETVLPGWAPADPLPLNLPQGKYITSYYGVAA